MVNRRGVRLRRRPCASEATLGGGWAWLECVANAGFTCTVSMSTRLVDATLPSADASRAGGRRGKSGRLAPPCLRGRERPAAGKWRPRRRRDALCTGRARAACRRGRVRGRSSAPARTRFQPLWLWRPFRRRPHRRRRWRRRATRRPRQADNTALALRAAWTTASA